MKKQIVILVIAILGLGLMSCVQDDDLVTPQQGEEVNVDERESRLKSISSYNPSVAVTYALQYTEECWVVGNPGYWNAYAFSSRTYNPYYKDWASIDSDCANFVSQCLKAGGIPYYSTSNPPVSNYLNWWYNNNGTYGYTTSDDYCSSSWNNAAKLYQFLSIKFAPSKTTITSFSSYSSLIQGVAEGDLIFVDEHSNGIEHVYIVTDVVGSTVKVSAHTGNRKNVNLYYIVEATENNSSISSWSYTSMRL